jgi:hypothetical protein
MVAVPGLLGGPLFTVLVPDVLVKVHVPVAAQAGADTGVPLLAAAAGTAPRPAPAKTSAVTKLARMTLK